MSFYINIPNREEWEGFMQGCEEVNFLQSFDFYDFHRERGNDIHRSLIYKDGETVGAWGGVVEKAKRGTYLAIAGGPIIDWDDKELVKVTVEDIKKWGEFCKCDFVRIRPQEPESEKMFATLKKFGFRKAPMYLSVEYAGILDLTKSEEEILAGASQGFRRKLRKAEKLDLEIAASADDEAIEEFCKLEKLHAERQKYVAFSAEFLRKQFETFREHNEVLIYTAKLGGEILAMNFMIFYGKEASYHYGVSSELGTKYSAAPLLHLKAMEEARGRGCTRYNLWGIVGTEEKNHRFYGVSEFKRSFGCEELKYTPAHDLVLKPLSYQKTLAVEKIRKKIRHV